MGQYYKPIILSDDNKVVAYMYSHDYDNGLKLMEHSYIGNNFVETFASLLAPDQPYYKSRVVWAGDYADLENEDAENLYHQCEDDLKIHPTETNTLERFPYIVNHDKRLAVDSRTVPGGDWQIHPLPLLTCEGNGRGGGDFRGKDDLIGSWARDHISLEVDRPEGYTLIPFELQEDD